MYFVHVTSQPGVELISEVTNYVYSVSSLSLFYVHLCAFLSLCVSLCPCMFLSVCFSASFPLSPLLGLSLHHCFSVSPFSLSAFFPLFTCNSLPICVSFCISLFSAFLSHHLTLNPISISLCVYVFVCLSLLCVSRVSIRILTVLAKILIGATWITVNYQKHHPVRGMLSQHCAPHTYWEQGLDFPAAVLLEWQCLPRGHPTLRSPFQWSPVETVCFSGTPHGKWQSALWC